MSKNYLIIAILALIMVGAVVYGLTESGSPWDTRGKKFDQTRVSDLNNIKYGIDNYYSTNKKLPNSLSDLKQNNTYAYYQYSDPESKQPYGFKTTGDTSYQLCATYSQKSDQNPNQNLALPPLTGGSMVSTHPKGLYCADLTVATYPIYNNFPTPTPEPTPNLTGTPLAKCSLLTAIASGSANFKTTQAVEKLQIMGIYETSNSVIFTTNKIANASIDRWTSDPKIASGFYYYGSQVFDSQTNGSPFNNATGYRIKVFDPTGDTTTSADYIFQGNKTVIADPRCK